VQRWSVNARPDGYAIRARYAIGATAADRRSPTLGFTLEGPDGARGGYELLLEADLTPRYTDRPSRDPVLEWPSPQ